MKHILIFVLIIVIIILMATVGSIVYRQFFSQTNFSRTLNQIKENMAEQPLINKKIAMVVAFRDFRDEEYFVPKEFFQKAQIDVKTVSDKTGIAVGADGAETQVDFLLEELKPADFDAVVFVGGPGCLSHLDNENAYKVIKETIALNKVLGSICISPVILAKAGVLTGKRATVWSSALDQSPVKILEQNGAIYEKKSVVRDGNIITANGPSAALEFAQNIIKVLQDNK